MEEQSRSTKVKRIRPETLEFIILYNQLRGRAFNGNTELATVLGFNSPASITEIIKSRQNIDPDKLQIFKEKYRDFLSPAKTIQNTPATPKQFEGIPMYEVVATASGVVVYNDLNEMQPVGHMNFPGIEDCDF